MKKWSAKDLIKEVESMYYNDEVHLRDIAKFIVEAEFENKKEESIFRKSDIANMMGEEMDEFYE